MQVIPALHRLYITNNLPANPSTGQLKIAKGKTVISHLESQHGKVLEHKHSIS